MHRFRNSGLIAVLLSLLATADATAAGAGFCRVSARSSQPGRELILLICSRDAGDRVWRTQSQVACAVRSRCSVWIWDDASKVPDRAPATDAGISRTFAAAAVALWKNDSQRLIRLQR